MFTILLLGIFALTAISVAVIGAKVYANSADKMHANYDTRTSIVYLSEKIRTNPDDSFDVRDLNGSLALVLSKEVNGTVYESWLFVTDDYLREAPMIVSGDTVLPGAAQRIMPLQSLDAKLRDGGIEITVLTVDGELNTTFLSGRTSL